MDKQLEQWQDETMPADEFWSDIVTHGANSGGEISDKTFADGMASIRGIAQQMKKKPVSKEARAKGKATQKLGDDGEKIAREWLNLHYVGFLKGDKVNREKTSFNGKWATKARADFSGVDPLTGKMMLCEVKSITDDRLQHGELRKHQTDNLNRLAGWNGVSILIIVKDKQVAALKWPVAGFKKGTSIKWADALRDRVNQ